MLSSTDCHFCSIKLEQGVYACICPRCDYKYYPSNKHLVFEINVYVDNERYRVSIIDNISYIYKLSDNYKLIMELNNFVWPKSRKECGQKIKKYLALM